MFGRFVHFPKIHTIFDKTDDNYTFIVFVVDTSKLRQCPPKDNFHESKHNKCVFVELTCNLGQNFVCKYDVFHQTILETILEKIIRQINETR